MWAWAKMLVGKETLLSALLLLVRTALGPEEVMGWDLRLWAYKQNPSKSLLKKVGSFARQPPLPSPPFLPLAVGDPFINALGKKSDSR